MTPLNAHPATLKIYFTTEMWERYGFYVVQTLLALFLAAQYNWPDKRIYSLVGSFTALTYLSPVVGGWIADHLIGQKRAVLTGAVVLGLSYMVLFLFHTQEALLCALAGIAVGTGLLKPNISSLLGNDYPMNSPNRDNGFTIFYLGITTGIILGTTLPSYFYYYFGWSSTFASAAFGMLLSLSVFAYGIRHYRIIDYTVHPFAWLPSLQALAIMLGLWAFSLTLLTYTFLADITFTLVVIGSALYLSLTMRQEPPLQAKQTLVIGLLCVISIVFWAFYFQMFLSLTLFIARLVQPYFLGIAFPAPYYVGVQSIGMIVFGLFMTKRKPKPYQSHQGIRSANKFIAALGLMCFAYALIALVCSTHLDAAFISPALILPAYMFISLAELLLSPVGLAAVTVLASREKVSTMMGVFFVSLGVGAFLSGKLASITALPAGALTLLDLKFHYAQGFAILFCILLVLTLLSGLLNAAIRKALRC